MAVRRAPLRRSAVLVLFLVSAEAGLVDWARAPLRSLQKPLAIERHMAMAYYRRQAKRSARKPLG